MRIQTSHMENGIILIEVEGEVDARQARELDSALNTLLAQGHNRLLLDVSQMDFISSAGLEAIVFAYREARRHGGQVRICGPNAEVRWILETARLDEYLHLSDTCQEAMVGW